MITLAVVAVVGSLHNLLMVDSMCLATINIVDGLVVKSSSGAGEAVVVAVGMRVSSVLSVADLFAVIFVAGGAFVWCCCTRCHHYGIYGRYVCTESVLVPFFLLGTFALSRTWHAECKD